WLGGQIWADSERVGITGFCWGGKVVWQAAARFAAFGAGVAWYGRLAPEDGATAGAPWPVDMAGDLKAPVLGLYGENDRGIPVASVEAMREALTREGQTTSEIVLYTGAGHAFHADYRPSYQAEAAADGWSRLLAHFQTHL
ncbi:dienelactone hydrolase family protein, partial [Brevundimonas sp.]|uniref:dienelactone hydrolase family protein n=1 Tax=Brevundimonas sp. TaxID=1871086 RepID=UPI001D1BEAB8